MTIVIQPMPSYYLAVDEETKRVVRSKLRTALPMLHRKMLIFSPELHEDLYTRHKMAVQSSRYKKRHTIRLLAQYLAEPSNNFARTINASCSPCYTSTMSENPNKTSAVQFLKLMSSGKVDEAYDQFTLPTGKHHSPHFPAGFDALKKAMKQSYQQFPEKQSEIKHVVGEDDMVAVHSHVVLTPGDLGFAIVHLFRFEDRKIVELWDFTQPISDDSPNTDGAF